jgi:hypothetical protein
VRLDRSATSIAATAAGVWVATDPNPGDRGTLLVRLDARTGRIAMRAPVGSWGAVLGATEHSLWALDSQHEDTPPRVRRLAPDDGATLATAAATAPAGAVATAPGAVWTLSWDGTVAQRDPRSGRVVARAPKLRELLDEGENALAADRRGVWAVSPRLGAVLRIEGGRIARRIAVGRNTVPVIARESDALWVVSARSARDGYRLARVDAASGAVTATADLGVHRPTALVPTRGGLWVVAGDGNALLIQTDHS